ncbi:hypothetical protein ABTQ33_12810 (plasmid) [Paucilactobacillus suebicus]|uniref:Uncharacterized protein n=1 Tax=Paucilactobacillus suebicus DSM 5007 = KCTC 3549 TaxID=1423807 RepID=A0A0R1VTX0_9LACO|nr:hypothetical protein [Paucilactobacillus suebicus]KRM09198.1 hypothetical protein FD16_GL001916 [Paucilactobacillus suebicus DSM 5007 = KCTC 3549]
MTKIDMELLHVLESDYGDLSHVPEDDKRLAELRKPFMVERSQEDRQSSRVVKINQALDKYISLGVKNGWSKAETLYWLNQSGPLQTNVTNSQIERRISFRSISLTRKPMDFDHNDQAHIDRIILDKKAHGKSHDQIATMINDLGYGSFVDAPYVTHRYRKLIPKHEMKPELTGEEKRIVDVQIEVAMNTEMNVNDLVKYLNDMSKIKHEVTRDVVTKRAKRMHIKLEGM